MPPDAATREQQLQEWRQRQQKKRGPLNQIKPDDVAGASTKPKALRRDLPPHAHHVQRPSKSSDAEDTLIGKIKALEQERNQLQQQVQWHAAKIGQLEQQVGIKEESEEELLRKLQENAEQQLHQECAADDYLIELRAQTSELRDQIKAHDDKEIFLYSKISTLESTLGCEVENNEELRGKLCEMKTALRDVLGENEQLHEDVMGLRKQTESESCYSDIMSSLQNIDEDMPEPDLATPVEHAPGPSRGDAWTQTENLAGRISREVQATSSGATMVSTQVQADDLSPKEELYCERLRKALGANSKLRFLNAVYEQETQQHDRAYQQELGDHAHTSAKLEAVTNENREWRKLVETNFEETSKMYDKAHAASAATIKASAATIKELHAQIRMFQQRIAQLQAELAGGHG